MELVLTTHAGRPAVEIEDHRGEAWKYTYRVRAGRRAWVVTLGCIDPATGEPAVDRRGRERSYVVTFTVLGRWCQCMDYQCRRRAAGEDCKHLRHARALYRHWLELTGREDYVRAGEGTGGAVPA